jgi:hypothetical protein
MDFDKSLFEVKEAATFCSANAHNFIDSFSKCVWSKASLAASRQATRKLGQINRAADRLEDHIRQFERHSEINAVLEHLKWATAQERLKPRGLIIEKISYETAHEAAVAIANSVISAVHRAEGPTDVAICENLAKQLRHLSHYPDYFGLIESEYRRAIEIAKPVELSLKEKQKIRDDQIKLIYKNKRPSSEKNSSKWVKLADLANDDPKIKQLGLKPITRWIARNVIEPPHLRLDK